MIQAVRTAVDWNLLAEQALAGQVPINCSAYGLNHPEDSL